MNTPRTPEIRWLPSFNGEIADEPFSAFSSEESCNEYWEDAAEDYTGAVEFREVIA